MGNMFRCTLASGGGAIVLTVTCDADFAGLTITATDGTTTLTQTCPSTSPYEVEFKIPNAGQWTISGVISGETQSITVDIPDNVVLHNIPNGSTVTPINNIQIWLHCANIWDKSYTTITQVLNDASTLQALIASNNAVDYMSRSTTWASDVTADLSAMSYIGLNDYCSDKLLADSTWLAAICNSTYFESVLNVKVPTMTSNTTPSGIVSAINYHSGSGNYPYCAFDGQNNTYWKPSVNTANAWLRYEFEEPVCVNKIDYTFVRGGSVPNPTIIFQGSNDGNTWEDITTTITLTQDVTQSIISSNRTKYKMYQLYNNGNKLYPSSGNFYNLATLQYYGRA